MAKKIVAFSTWNLPYAALLDFISQVISVLKRAPAVELAWGEALEHAHQAFLQNILKKKLEPRISLKEVDQRINEIWHGLQLILKGAVTNPEDEGRAAAIQIAQIFEQYPDLRRERYARSYGFLESFMQAIGHFEEETFQKALVFPWIRALRETFNEFKRLRIEQNLERSQFEVGSNLRFHDELCKTYSECIDHLNAAFLLYQDEAHVALNAQLNQVIADYRLQQRISRNRVQDSEEDETETDQPEVGTQEDSLEMDHEDLDQREEIDEPVLSSSEAIGEV